MLAKAAHAQTVVALGGNDAANVVAVSVRLVEALQKRGREADEPLQLGVIGLEPGVDHADVDVLVIGVIAPGAARVNGFHVPVVARRTMLGPERLQDCGIVGKRVVGGLLRLHMMGGADGGKRNAGQGGERLGLFGELFRPQAADGNAARLTDRFDPVEQIGFCVKEHQQRVFEVAGGIVKLRNVPVGQVLQKLAVVAQG